MKRTAASLVLALSVLTPRLAAADGIDDVRLEAARIGELSGQVGALSAVADGSGRQGVDGGGRIDLATIDARDLRAFLLRAELDDTTTGQGAFAGQLAGVDFAILEGHSTLGDDGQRVVVPCLWIIANPPCTSGGHLGLGADLPAWQASLDSSRRVARVGALDVVGSLESSGAAGWLARRLPLRVGITMDDVYGVTGASATWIARLDVGADALFQLAHGRAELDARIRYRPSLAAWSSDFAVEATMYVGYKGRHYVLQPQGAPFSCGLEIGYAYWANPSHSFGVTWSEVAPNTLFARLVFRAALWSVH